jgi:hypothetical protein
MPKFIVLNIEILLTHICPGKFDSFLVKIIASENYNNSTPRD